MFLSFHIFYNFHHYTFPPKSFYQQNHYSLGTKQILVTDKNSCTNGFRPNFDPGNIRFIQKEGFQKIANKCMLTWNEIQLYLAETFIKNFI